MFKAYVHWQNKIREDGELDFIPQMEIRLSGHYNEKRYSPNSKKNLWIEELKECGLEPIPVYLGEVTEKGTEEDDLISLISTINPTLTNMVSSVQYLRPFHRKDRDTEQDYLLEQENKRRWKELFDSIRDLRTVYNSTKKIQSTTK